MFKCLSAVVDGIYSYINLICFRIFPLRHDTDSRIEVIKTLAILFMHQLVVHAFLCSASLLTTIVDAWYDKSLLDKYYRKISNIKHTKSQNVNAFRLVLQLPLPNPFKPDV